MTQRTVQLAVAGDAILTRPISQYTDSQFLSLVETIRETDAAVANLEVLLHDYEGYPAQHAPGTYMRAPPRTADELEWFGFDMFTAATNHTMDYSHGGMNATMRELERRNIPYAGLGKNLTEARAPAYFDSPAGRVALVAACSTIASGSIAGQQRPDVQGRPGLSPLRLQTTYTVPEAMYERLRTLSQDLGLEAAKRHGEALGFPLVDADAADFQFLNMDGDSHLSFNKGSETHVTKTTRTTDRQEITDQIEEARRQADLVVASLHAHEGQGTMFNDQTVPKFMQSFARHCIDEGADAFIGHGPHVLRGIELYEEAPIFYSLGNIFMQNETITRLPADIYNRYGLAEDATPADVFDQRIYDEDGEPKGFLDDDDVWKSVLPVCEYSNGELTGVALHPVDLRPTESRPRRGRPRRAEGKRAVTILEDLQELSDSFGTTIEIDSSTGRILM